MKGHIGDLFSGEQRQILLVWAVQEGEVFRMHLGDEEDVKGKKPEDDGRNKFFIVLGHDAEGNAIGFVLINSEINASLPVKRKDMHYPLYAKAYPFLDGKNRFVDCSDFKIISQKKFTKLFGSQTSKGQIDTNDLEYIKNAVATYEDASPKLLKRFGLI